jgi:hypothetical protein
MKHWTGAHFERTSLQDVGLVVQLGHEDGQPCVCPEEGPKGFTVVSTNGIHKVSVMYCGCHHAGGGSAKNIQLLRASWFPATIIRPRTAFTFDVLEAFHLLNLQGKTSAYDYYLSLVHRTDNTGTQDVKVSSTQFYMWISLSSIQDCYEQFFDAERLWRHLILAKRAARGHDPEGIEATLPGDCAVLCPACPHPELNLPKDWETSPEETR